MRRTATVTITAEGRDQGKAFLLTEMPAAQAERWATRAIMALIGSGMEIPDDVANAGMAGVASMGFKAFGGIRWEIASDLLDEMWNCVQAIGDPKRPNVVRALVEDDTEEVATRVKLRMEVFTLHTGFSLAELKSKLTSATNRTQDSSAPQTSPAQSPQ